MIYIVHGEDIAKSRALILNQQKKLGADSRVELDITDTTPEHLLHILNTSDIFGNFPYVVLDVSDAGRTNLEKHLEKLLNAPKEANIIILSNKSLSSANIFIKHAKKLGAKVVVNEKIVEGKVFDFVDALFEKQRQRTYIELEKVLLNEGPFEIFNRILYGLRNLGAIKFQSAATTKMNPYVKMKTQKLVQLYSEEQITKLFSEMQKIDKAVKTGEIDEHTMLTLAVEKVLCDNRR